MNNGKIPADVDRLDAYALSHLDLVEKSQVVLRLGKTLLSCGAGAYRVKSAMSRAARAVGLSRHESHVSLMEIITTSWQGHNYRTEVVEIRSIGVNVDKLDQLMALCIRLHHDMTVAELNAALDEIDKRTRHYPIWASVLASAIACAAFSFLNSGRLVECATVFVAAGAGQWIRRLLLGRKVTHFAVWITCAAASTLLYIGIIAGATHFGVISGAHHAGVISAILYLIPGFPLTTAILDFVRMDFWSALTRMNYCLMVIGSAGLSVWMVSHFLGWPVEGPAPEPLNYWVLFALRIVTSFAAAYGFAVLFNAPWKVAAAGGAIGAFVNTGRLVLQGHDMSWQLAVGMAAFVAGCLATLVASRTMHSRVSLSVPAVVIMIPGVPFYRALVALNEGDFFSALGPISEVFFVVMSIGFGLAVARIVTDPGWLFDSETAVLPDDLDKTARAAHY
ncbi:threonine/serine exporter ThrE family protein [Trueperella sp. LYQ143]|uniref:threonine/serine ThrE exporter family protein n=1 Tax=unclassified Trueperella TaxID=2630174 RepID=UPI0039837F40